MQIARRKQEFIHNFGRETWTAVTQETEGKTLIRVLKQQVVRSLEWISVRVWGSVHCATLISSPGHRNWYRD